jgi:hypothetical protein
MHLWACPSGENPCRFVPVFFLNCTKNAELTGGHFARTFRFALTRFSAGRAVPQGKARQRISSRKTQPPDQDMKTVEWKTYRTRFLVKAKQLSSGLSFTDHLGRQHCGRKGDYLVESSDGVLSIAPRQIFEDIYVPMAADENVSNAIETAESDLNPAAKNPITLKRFPIEPLEIERITADKFSAPIPARRRTDHLDPSRGRRKSPQPFRATRASSHLTVM